MTNHSTNDWADVAGRLLGHLDAGTTDSAAGPFTVAVADYLDEQRWTLEMERVFRREKFARDLSSRGLTELPCAERAGFVFAVLDPSASLDVDGWLAGYDAVLSALGLDDVDVLDERELVGPNWKIAFDGYVDGYHLDILHRDTLGRDVVGNGGTSMMISQLCPGPTPDRSRTVQTYVVRRGATADQRAAALEQADFLERVVVEEDYRTGLGIQGALGSGGNTEFVFGSNEPGNQRLHQWVDELVDG